MSSTRPRGLAEAPRNACPVDTQDSVVTAGLNSLPIANGDLSSATTKPETSIELRVVEMENLRAVMSASFRGLSSQAGAGRPAALDSVFGSLLCMRKEHLQATRARELHECLA